MSKLAEYTTLLLLIPPLPPFPQPATHTLYIRAHSPKIATESDERSLFVVNVPVDATEAHFRAIFTSLLGAGVLEGIEFEGEVQKHIAGKVESKATGKMGKKRKRGGEGRGGEGGMEVELPQIWDRPLRKSGGTAVVRLVDEKSVERVLKAIRRLHRSAEKGKSGWPVWGEGVEGKIPALGSKRYEAHHRLRYPDEGLLRANVDAYMLELERRETEKGRENKRLRGVPDEDGFVTVTRGGRVGPARQEEVEAKRVEMEERERKKREGMGDFYRFQMRERRKVEQGELVKRFEEDRKKVEGMKERRGRFRPES